jgi:hypothetical protein
MSKKILPTQFDGDEEDALPRYTQNSWDYVTPAVRAGADSKRTEAEVRAKLGLPPT